MSPQADYVVSNGTGAAVRSDINGQLAAIVSNNSGASAPATTYAYMLWADTSTNLLKLRNGANSAWITVGDLTAANLGLATVASPTFTGTATIPTLTVSSAANIPLGSAGSPTLYFTGDSNTGLYSPGADQVALSTGGTGRLFIDSSGRCGIGDSSPSAKLVCNGSIQVTSSTNPSTGAGLEIGYGTVNASRTALQSYNRTGSAWLGADYNALDHRFYISGGGSPQMTLTSTGLGIGATTFAASPTSRLNIKQTSNTRYDGLWIENSANEIGIGIGYDNASDCIAFSPSYGSTGSYKGIAFYTSNLERGRWDTSGRLLVGTSTSRNNFFNLTTYNPRLQIEGTDYSSSMASVVCNSTTDSSVLIIGRTRGTSVGSNTAISSGDSLGVLSFQGSDGSELVEAARIEAYVDATPGANDMPGRLVFSTTADGAASPTERMRITGLGYVKAANSGTYVDVTGAKHEFHTNAADHTMLQRNTHGSTPYGLRIDYTSDPNNTFYPFLFCASNTTTLRAEIRSNGGLANYSANNVNLSDINTKKDITPAAGTWDCLKEWEIVNFRYKDQPDDADLNMGVIAQQVAKSCPEVITVFSEATEDAPEKLGIKEQQMYWMAIKALQEAQVRIEQLEAKVAALESA